MRRKLGFAMLVAATTLLVGAMPVAAGERVDVTITVTTIFDGIPDEFVSTGLGSACAAGTVEDGKATAQFHRGANVFAGFKVFTCSETTGFVLRLNARFGDWGSVGSWSVVDAWGSVAGISGAGSLTGDPLNPGIQDNYVGTITH